MAEPPLPLRKNGMNSKEKAVRVWYRRQGCKFSSSASAQDLRCFKMEKEKEETSSPRGVLEAFIRGLDTEAVSPNPNILQRQIHSSNSQALSRWRGFSVLWKKSSIKRLPSFPPFAVPKISRRESRSVGENVDTDFCYFKSSWKNFTFSELLTATNNFSKDNLIARGGYAEVYRGCLPDGQLVAVKRPNKGTTEDQIISFLTEIGTIAHVNHPNTAKLIGFGVQGGTYVVLQLSPLGSLGSLLRGSKEKLNWAVRYKIILGTAAGLLYLHIYFAPEYFMYGIVDEKTDVFSFGVLLLELITGREALDDSQQSLVLWAKPLLDNNNVKQLVDPSLGDNYDLEEMDRVILTASLCIEQSPILRPRMNQVVILLRGENYFPECSKECQKRYLQRTFSEELLDAEEYNSTKYFSDLNRHKEVALGS
ncbi:Receptor-like cytosolic serine/threonine-protein kinase RBK2 [Camellia lanceoleosa]|uniref:Receptor-like cytosolic serine/threonine-protein kinase RBK2 n=1 Tax=Camellia lanceoleosa TaxID=1840588 RepID=A0ACC0IJ60_9ERIC|nr:Receptor-like cytosolic serine/threonine-protein kinase RBK2 [Camellia lanceoleosa]